MTLYITDPADNREIERQASTVKGALETLEDLAGIRLKNPMQISHRLIGDSGEDLTREIEYLFDNE